MKSVPKALKNIESEQAVLGAILYEPQLIDDCVLTMRHFSTVAHQTLFKSFVKLSADGKPIDTISVVKELGDRLDLVGGLDYLDKLTNSVPTTKNFKYYESLTLETFKLRMASDLVKNFSENPSEQALNDMTSALEHLQDDEDDEEESDEDVLVSIHESLFEERGDITGVPTGMNELDRMTNGLQDGELIIVAGRPSMGKTAFALNIGLHAADKGTVVDIISLEMPKKQVMQRSLSVIANIDAGKWKNPNRFMTQGQKDIAVKAMGIYKQLPHYIHDNPSQTILNIRSKVRRSIKLHPDKKHLVVIDYLGLINSTKRNDRKDLEIAEITKGLKQMARKFKVPVVLLSQLSRSVEQRQDKRPIMSDLRDSGAIEQDADLIMFLYRDDYYNKDSEKQNMVEVIIGKQRNGPIGTVELAFIKEIGKFVNLDRRES